MSKINERYNDMQKDFSLKDYMDFYNLETDNKSEHNTINVDEDQGNKGVILEDKRMILKN